MAFIVALIQWLTAGLFLASLVGTMATFTLLLVQWATHQHNRVVTFWFGWCSIVMFTVHNVVTAPLTPHPLWFGYGTATVGLVLIALLLRQFGPALDAES